MTLYNILLYRRSIIKAKKEKAKYPQLHKDKQEINKLLEKDFVHEKEYYNLSTTPIESHHTEESDQLESTIS